MKDALSPNTQAFLREALAQELPPHARQRVGIKRAVLATATLAPSAAIASGAGISAGKAAAAKAVHFAWLGTMGGKVTAGAVFVIGTVTSAAQVPWGDLSEEFFGSQVAVVATSNSSAAVKRRAPRERVRAMDGSAQAVAQGRSVSEVVAAGAGEAAAAADAKATRENAIARDAEAKLARRVLAPAPREAAEPSARVAQARGNSMDTSEPSTEPLARELAELECVQALLRGGQGQAALDALDARASEGALLRDERLASEVFAACQVGQFERARNAAQLFLSRASGSILAERVRRSCAFSQTNDKAEDGFAH